MIKIKKAVLPVAGFGTRFLPATKAIPKEMLAIIDKPLIEYAVEEAISAGAEEIIFITSHTKPSIEKHFSEAPELEKRLKDSGKLELLKKIQPEKTFHYDQEITIRSNWILEEKFAIDR